MFDRKNIGVFLIIGLSTMPFFKSSIGFYLTYLYLFISLRYFPLFFKKEVIWFFLFAAALEIYHLNYFAMYELQVTRQVLLYFLFSFLIAYYVGASFFEIYIKILYYFSMISLVVFFANLAVPSIIKALVDSSPAIFKSTFETYTSKVISVNPVFYNFDNLNFALGRNNGPFWEPTIFACMLIIAQIFNLLTTKTFFNKNGLIFSLCVLTTFSTTGYVAFFLLLLGYFLIMLRINVVLKVFVTVFFLFVSVLAFTNLNFLGTKIQSEISNVDDDIAEYSGNSRAASAVIDIAEISERSIYLWLGKGSSRFSRIGSDDKDVLRNCGLTGLLVKWGLPFAVLYLVMLYASFINICKYFEVSNWFALFFWLIFILISLSEVIFDLPFFHVFLFLGFVLKGAKFSDPVKPVAAKAKTGVTNRLSYYNA